MRFRFVLFVVLGTVLGACGGLVTTVGGLGLEDVVPDGQDPQLLGEYRSILLNGAAIWAIFGFVSSALQFVFTIGSSPEVIDTRTGLPLQDPAFERFDDRHVGSKLLVIGVVWGVIAATVVLPSLSVEGLAEPRSMFGRLLICIVSALVFTVPVQPVSSIIIIWRARRRLM